MIGERELKKGSTHTLILAVLGEGPLHGYAIAREIERRTDDALRISEGSLYPALRSLENDEFVESAWEVQSSGPARRIYKLTEKGKGALAQQVSMWRQFTKAVTAVIGGEPNARTA